MISKRRIDTYPDVLEFIQEGGITLRGYQEGVARAVVASVLEGRGLSFAVMFPRQSGKNELQAQIETYLLAVLRDTDAEIVKVSPTWRPQSLNAMRRLERVLSRHPQTKKDWEKESGYIFRLGRARIIFLSGSPLTNIVGATASTLLEVDEAQDVKIEKYDRDIAPMAASTNATRVFWGTAWTTRTLLARELRAAREEEEGGKGEGGKREKGKLAFVLTAEDVAREVAEYGRFVAGQVARLGRDHPNVRTQYFAEEIDGEAGMFPPWRLALMQGSHSAQDRPSPGKIYAMLLDVAGEDENRGQWPGESGQQQKELANPKRDATALTVVEVDLSTAVDPLVGAPTHRVMHRRLWVGVNQLSLRAELCALAELWRARRVVVDATGVGEGLTNMLQSALFEKVIPFKFTASSKSQMGWQFLGVASSGRWKEPVGNAALSQRFFQEARLCESRVAPGPAHQIRWGVPDGTRDPQTNDVV
ncbi:MAG: hypothetical protein EHM21_13675, partial [Chloroflexi bacterium]